jgi:hypothetical protein
MKKQIIIRTSSDIRPNAFKLHFTSFMNYLRESGLFFKATAVEQEQEKKIISTENLWQTLIEDGNYSLVKILQRVENNEFGYGSIVVPKGGFSEKESVHNMVLDWLRERNVNVIDVENEISCLEKSLHREMVYNGRD